MIEWKKFGSKSPTCGSPLLVKMNGVVQNIVYFRDGSDSSIDWLEPFGDYVDEDLRGELSFFIDFESDIEFIYLSDLA